MEMATFLGDVERPGRFTDPASCPFQQDKLCTVHSIRPLGCRIFFCDQTATDWQQDQYARLHSELKRLHNELEIPYFYVEWRDALQAIGLSDVVSP